jgi:glycerol-3-phosphate dehydrogenase
MSIKYIARMGATVTTVLLLAAGCATHEGAVTQADLDALRDEIAMVRADSKAAAADAAAAKMAAEESKTASEESRAPYRSDRVVASALGAAAD